ncbi:hypothetical protein VNO80_09410 [Phaseolus coccineus]|uniref:Uncharacterized protein n=1 Tax=Phaseolus coccineus TaxID=3886 RepID=A0AAN9RID5_PHACN
MQAICAPRTHTHPPFRRILIPHSFLYFRAWSKRELRCEPVTGPVVSPVTCLSKYTLRAKPSLGPKGLSLSVQTPQFLPLVSKSRAIILP